MLRSWLPARVRDQLFDPAWHDLRIHALSGGHGRLWLAARSFTIFLQCWWLAIADAMHRRLPSQRPFIEPPSSPPKEPFSMFWNDLRHAFRLLLREPGFTIAAVLTLALGVGGNVAVFAVVEAVLLHPLPYPDADRLVIVRHRNTQTGVTKPDIALGDYVDLSQRQSVFESLPSYGAPRLTLYGMEEPIQVQALAGTAELLETLGARPALGRLLTKDDSRKNAPPVIVLSHEFWKSRFASDPTVIGRGLKLGAQEGQVVGVVQPGFRFPPNARTDLILPMEMRTTAPAARKSGWAYSVARLKPGVSLKEADANLKTISGQLAKEFPRANQGSEYYALPLRDALVGDTKPALILILSAVGLLLLIACGNVANLLLARSLGRRREMAVRAALGAGQRRLAGQMLAESLALAICAGTAGVLFALWGSRALVAMVPRSVHVPGLEDVRVNLPVLAFALGVTLVTALVFGMMSALSTRKQTGSEVLAAARGASSGTGARRMAAVLIGGEVALAVVLLIGAGLVVRSFSRLLAVDPGFRTDHILTVETMLPFERYRDADATRAFWDRTFAAIRAIPGVQEVGAAQVTPLTGNHWTASFDRPENPTPAGEKPPEVGWQMCNGAFFKAMGIPLLSGRFFDDRDRPKGPVPIIVSASLERRYFPEGATGREIRMGNQKAEIVGVVGDIRRADLSEAPRTDMYFSFEVSAQPIITLFIRTAGEPEKLTPSVQAAVRAQEPNAIFMSAQSMENVARESLQVMNLALWLLGLFAATALALAAVGIYGVMAYAVRQRTREIGTRIALGATARDIGWMVLRQAAVIAAIGTAVGLTAGLIAARALGTLLYGIKPSDPVTLVIATGVLILTALAASYLPARRAARIDPARTLAEQ